MKDNFRGSALRYYARSVPTLLFRTGFWRIPLVLAGRRPILSVAGGLRYRVATLMDVWTLKEVVLDRVYEHRHRLAAPGTVIDIGAAFGDFSIMADRLGCDVIAYEPSPDRLELMRENMRLNQCSRIRLHEKAATSLDQVFAENDIRQCAFLKIDCEGAEYAILRNASDRTLSKISRLAMEVHLFDPAMQAGLEKLAERIEKAGLIVERVDNPVHDNLQYLYASQRLASQGSGRQGSGKIRR